MSSDGCTARGRLARVGDQPSTLAGTDPRFRFGLCTCDGYVGQGPLRTDALIEVGRIDPPIGSVGTNGNFHTAAPVFIGGTLWASSAAGITATAAANLTISATLLDQGGLMGDIAVRVGGDAYVGAAVSVRELIVGGTMVIPEGVPIAVTHGPPPSQRVSAPVQIAPPCGCASTDILDVGARVRTYRDDHDNAAANIDANALVSFRPAAPLVLPCGRYHLNGISGDADLSVSVSGRTTLLVEGAVEIGGTWTLTTAPGAELDVFVTGNMRVAGGLRRMQPATPPRGKVRFFIGGEGTLELLGPSEIAGLLYAPRAELVTQSTLEVWGAVFVRRAAAGGALTIHHDSAP